MNRGRGAVIGIVLVAATLLAAHANATDCPRTISHCQLVDAMSGTSATAVFMLDGVVVTASLVVEEGDAFVAWSGALDPGAVAGILFTFTESPSNATRNGTIEARVIVDDATAGVSWRGETDRSFAYDLTTGAEHRATFALAVADCPEPGPRDLPFTVAVGREAAKGEVATRLEPGTGFGCRLGPIGLASGVFLLVAGVGAFAWWRRRPL